MKQNSKILKKCIAAIHKFHSDNESKLINNGNPGSFFKNVNSKTSYKSGVALLRDLGGNLHSSDTDRAQLLNEHFATHCNTLLHFATQLLNEHFAFGQDDGRLLPFSIDETDFFPKVSSNLSNLGNVLTILKKLQSNDSGGVDNLPTLLFKILRPKCLSLYRAFSMSLVLVLYPF